MKKKPNVLFVVYDDLNDSVARMGGHPQAKTPFLDSLMARGVRFTNAQCNSPICGPSRASFLTGIYPHNSGLFGYDMFKNNWLNNPVLRNKATFMEYFKANGYEVYGTGKIFHQGHEKWEVWDDKDGNSNFGAKPNYGPEPWDGRQQTQKSWNNLAHPDLPDTFYTDCNFGRLGDIPEYKEDKTKGIPGYKGWILRGKPFRYDSAENRDLLPDELSAEYAVNILQRDFTKPFMLCIGFVRPHAPLIVPDEYFDLFPLETIQLTEIKKNDLEDCATVFKQEIPDISTGAHGRNQYKTIIEAGGEEMLKKWTQAYLASVAFADAQLGKVLKTLDRKGYIDNTIIVITSDNGYHMGEKEQLFKNTTWEEACRIPLIITGPGISKNKECSHPVSLVDIYPTLNELCGLASEPHSDKNLDGYSLCPFLEEQDNGEWDGPDVAITALASNKPIEVNQPADPALQHFSVRSERYRYILCNNGEEELYDHKQDPCEWNNIAAREEYQNVKNGLKRKLIEINGDKYRK